MRDIAEAIAASVNSSGQRFSIGKAPTFGARQAPTMFPSLVPQADAEALNFSSVDVTASGSAGLVAAGSPKPQAATVTITPRQIQKIGAYATINAESWWQSEDVISSVVATLYASCVTEEDKIANQALAVAAAAPVPQATWVEAISLGQSVVNAAGGSPNLVVLPAAMWPDVASEVAGSAGLSTPSNEAILSILGSRVVLSPEGTSAFVLDPTSCVHAVRDSGFLIDATGTSNTVTVVVDLVSSLFVQVPQLVAEISVTGALLASKKK